MTGRGDKHHRRSIRMAGYDYRQAGFYFVAICAQGGRRAFGEVLEERVESSGLGRMVQETWEELPTRYAGVELDAFVVMRNHVHGIIILDPVGAGPRACPEEQGQPQGVAPTLSLGDVVHRFKSLTTARYRRAVVEKGWVAFAGRLWQRNYYERVIRNEDELNRVRQYIVENPLKWAYDPENPKRLADREYEREWGWLHGEW